MSNEEFGRRMRLGYFVFASLAGLKVIEYFVTTLIKHGNLLYLTILAFASAWLIVYFYKHISELWRSTGEDDGE